MDIKIPAPVPGEDYPRNWNEFFDWFATEQACLAYLERLRWPQGFVCSSCGSANQPYRSSRARLMCQECGHQSTVCAGTIFDKTLISLPLALGEISPRFPYLTPDPLKVEAWRERLSEDQNFKIGFSWTGRADHPRNDLRSVPILDLVRVLKDIPGVTFYSLQREHPDQARAAALIDFTSELVSVDDTAALISNLDLVIGVDSMTAHLAGALNVPTWVMVDVNPYWGWGRKDKRTIWYPSVRIYRQQRMHRWQEVFEEIRADLGATRAARH
jgi:hypothetical protein